MRWKNWNIFIIWLLVVADKKEKYYVISSEEWLVNNGE